MNDWEISQFQLMPVRKWSCKPGPLCFPRFIHYKTRGWRGREARGKTPPSQLLHPHTRSPLAWHHVSVTGQTALLGVSHSYFFFLSMPPLFLSSVPFFLTLSPCLPLVFVLFSQTTKGRQSRAWRHPSSLAIEKKRQLPPPTLSSAWIDNTLKQPCVRTHADS